MTKKQNVIFNILIVLALLFTGTPTQPAYAAGSIIRVASNGTTSWPCGTTWANACDLQTALTNAVSGDQIWVAAGVYMPGAARADTFQLVSGVEVYGGFNGAESALGERNPDTNLTILSGDIDSNDSQTPIITDLTTVTGNTTNSYHVLTGSGTDSTAVLDGFTITGGYANAGFPNSGGAGMLNNAGSPTLNDIIFSGNYATGGGGAMDNFGGSNPTLTNVTFNGNAANSGGAMYNDAATLSLTDVTFYANSANYGGAILNNEGWPAFNNVTFNQNSATNDGGGIYNSLSTPSLTNVTFSGNSAVNGGGIADTGGSESSMKNVTFHGNTATNNGGGAYHDGGSATYNNVIFWGNTATNGAEMYNYPSFATPIIKDSVIAGGCPTGASCTNLINTDPALGALADNGGYTQTMALGAGSSAIDAGGVNAACASDDQRGVTRPQGSGCDIGAYETYHGTFYAKPGASGERNCTSWGDACTLALALNLVSASDEIWVQSGTHVPGIARTDTFQLVGGVGVYGGFTGTETALNQSDPNTNITILSGDIDGDDSQNPITDLNTVTGNTNNTYHVVTGNGTTSSAILSGFTITGGYADGGGFPNGHGAGIFNDAGNPTLIGLTATGNRASNNGGAVYNISGSSPTLNQVTFNGNAASIGGAIYNNESAPTLFEVIIHDNTATSIGGGMYNFSSNPTLDRVTFSSNFATSAGGGMLNSQSSSPTLANVTFNNNQSNSTGGAMENTFSSNPILNHVTISGNTATNAGGGISNESSSPELNNVILWGNTANAGKELYESGSAPTMNITDSVVEGGCPAGTNCTNVINADPLLGALTNNGGYTQTMALGTGSSAIDAGGVNSTCAATDQREISRPQGGGCEIGAYEYIHSGTFHVSTDGSGSCTSWADTCSLSTALSLAGNGDEIWVKAGTYYPGTGIVRAESFQMLDGVGIYGGFDGAEITRNKRDPKVNLTTLSGDIGVPDIDTDNNYHVVTASGLDSTAVLDGFTVTRGYADNGEHGAGMYIAGGSPTVNNVVFSENTATTSGNGGALANIAGSPTLTNVSFISNQGYLGGGVYNENSIGLTISGATFYLNSGANGGAIYNVNSDATITNATFTENEAAYGGAIFNDNSPIRLNQITFNGNNATLKGGSTSNWNGSDLTISNVILWGDTATNSDPEIHNSASTPTIKNSVVQGSNGSGGSWVGPGTDSGGNLDADPLLDALVDNGGPTKTMALLSGSPAIDAGDNFICGTEFVNYLDQRGVIRPQGSGCDIGAYEVGGTQVGSNYIVNTSADTDDGYCDTLGQGLGNQDCTLREAITYSETNSTIGFAGSLSGHTITLGSALTIDKNLTIDSAIPITISGNNSVRVFEVTNSAVTFNNLTVTEGKNTTSLYAGGLTVDATSTVTVNNSVFTANESVANNSTAAIFNLGTLFVNNTTISNGSVTGYGTSAGIYNQAGQVEVTKSTIANNSALMGAGGGYLGVDSTAIFSNTTFYNNSSFDGGGMRINASSVVTIINSTLSHNAAIANGDNIYNQGTLYLYNSILANTADDCVNLGAIAANVNNLIENGSCSPAISGDPHLGPLQNNGGDTETMALDENSPAIDAGDSATCADVNTVNNLDQRGVTRPFGNACDIGAYEFSVNPENDSFVFAYDITLPNYTSSVNTTTATISTNDPVVDQCGVIGTGSATVWYTYAPTTNTAISIDTFGSDYDTFIAVWKDGTGGLELISCNDNSVGSTIGESQLAIQVQQGTTYYIEVGQP